MIAHNKVVSIEYEVSDVASKEMIDSNKSGAPLEFLVGANQIISGLENALMGAKTGDKLSVEVKPEDAYGIYQPDLIQEVARDHRRRRSRAPGRRGRAGRQRNARLF